MGGAAGGWPTGPTLIGVGLRGEASWGKSHRELASCPTLDPGERDQLGAEQLGRGTSEGWQISPAPDWSGRANWGQNCLEGRAAGG